MVVASRWVLSGSGSVNEGEAIGDSSVARMTTYDHPMMLAERVSPRVDLRAGEVHVFIVGVDEFPEHLSPLSERIDPPSGRRTTDPRHRAVVAGNVALRRMISSVLGMPAELVRIDRTCPHCGDCRHGKPKVIDPVAGELDYSISYSGAHTLVALARGCQVGVDIEAVGDDDRLSRSVFRRRGESAPHRAALA